MSMNLDNNWADEVSGRKYPAWSSVDVIRDENMKPVLKTRRGWQLVADRNAAKMLPRGFWHGVVAWVPWRNAYRINYGGMPTER